MTKAAGVVRRALLSVSDKTNLVDFARGLHDLDVELVASGGTARTLEEAGITIVQIDAYTGAPEMLDLARRRVASADVRFIEADVFSWSPDRRYDAVFFGFWISHVPDERFDSFWAMVADALRPDGCVFFFDDHHRTSAELIEGELHAFQRRLIVGRQIAGEAAGVADQQLVVVGLAGCAQCAQRQRGGRRGEDLLRFFHVSVLP